MEFKDYYATLGVEQTAPQEQIKRAYRRLSRKYHPDVSKDPDATTRFKEVAQAYEALSDPEKRAAYDDAVQRGQRGAEEFRPQPGWDSGFEFSGRDFGAFSQGGAGDLFETLFGRTAQGRRSRGPEQAAGEDHHAKVQIDLEEAFRGGKRTVSLRMPVVDVRGQVMFQTRQIEVDIPKGVSEGQHLRLVGQGGAGYGGGPAGDLYLEVSVRPHPYFRLEGRDVYLDLPITPWEAGLGAQVSVPTPDGAVQLTIPPGASSGQKLRLKGKGLPGHPRGDMYAVLGITAPPAASASAKKAYAALASSFPNFNPRGTLEATAP